MSVDSGMESKATTEAPQEKPDPTVVARQAASQRLFLSLLPEIRNKILEARGKSNLVKRSLEEGNWSALVRALRGIQGGASELSPYEPLARLIEAITPEELRVERKRKKSTAKPPVD